MALSANIAIDIATPLKILTICLINIYARKIQIIQESIVSNLLGGLRRTIGSEFPKIFSAKFLVEF